MNFIFRSRPYPIVLIALFLLAVGCAKAPEKIEFRRVKNLPSELLTGVSELKKTALPQGNFRAFSFERPLLKKLRNGNYLPVLKGAQVLSEAGQPRVPMFKYTFSVPKGKRVGLKLLAPELEASHEKIQLTKAEKPLVWGKNTFEFVESKKSSYFPGRLFDVHQEKENVYVTVFPVQVELKTGKVLNLVQGVWELTLEKEERRWRSVKHSPALILTSQKFLKEAKVLAKIHAEKLKVESQIETVENIASREEPVDVDELPDGYKTPEIFEDIVKPYHVEKGTGYDFELARKIISFLKKRADEDSEFKYVVILGNSEVVPPSYYFASQSEFGGPRTGVTDQCYGATQECLKPRLAVGRLPFGKEEEINLYLSKLENWLAHREEYQSELGLYGGRAFKSSPLYIGELGTLVTVDKKGADWSNVKKRFETEGNFNKESVKKLISGEEKVALAYYLDHGTGNRWYAGDQLLTSFEVEDQEPSEGGVLPMVVSVSCINAAFDEPLLRDRTITDIGKYGVVSVGTALLQSKAGAIAYLGGARDGLGGPETEVDDNGNVEVLGTSYGLQFFDTFVEGYRTHQGSRIGDVLLNTLSSYAHKNGNDMSDFNHRWTFWISELLGDPLLPVTRLPNKDKAYQLAQSDYDKFENFGGMPVLTLDSSDKKPQVFPITMVDGPVTAKLYEMISSMDGFKGQKLLKSQSFNGSKTAEILLDAETELVSGKQYLIKLSNDEGVPRERHVVFSTKE